LGKIEADNSDCVVRRYWCPSIKYDPSVHPAQAIELGKKGYTRAQMASEFNIAKNTLEYWRKEHKEFAEAMELALTHAQAFGEKQLQDIAEGKKDGDVKAYIFKMKMQFKEDYTETRQINQTNTLEVKALPDDQLNKQIAAKLKLLSPEERQAMFPAISNVIDGEFVEVAQ
jgi:DNA-binding XRE family transcriptional regulator